METNIQKESNEISRREFLKVSAAAGTGILLSSSAMAAEFSKIPGKKRYAQVGVGHRAKMYQDAIYGVFKDNSEMVGFCDVNLGRLHLAQSNAEKATGKKIPIYDAKDFDKMIAETKPDVVIVTTVDGFHHKYIVKALESGVNVLTEKPLTVDEVKCQQIIDARRKTGKQIIVAFNYRYSPSRTQVKDLLMSGEIGDILSVDFHWMLNTFHGADYFRRWHSQKELSGGLMVHKATHHFDLVNWWLSAIPVSVFGMGKREFYTPKMIQRFGLKNYHERCFTCPENEKCAFELNLLEDLYLKGLYLDNEQYDRYYRDRCIFRPDITIEDTMNVIVKYDNQVTLSYSLNAFNSWEGYYIIFNGTKGRIEHKMEEKIFVDASGALQKPYQGEGTYIRLFPLRGPGYDIDVWQGTGGHAGGDAKLLEDLFIPEKNFDKYMHAADERAGSYSCLTGIAANHSFKTGKEIKISDLVNNLERPEFPQMPLKNESIPMPPKNKEPKGVE
jgi:predicted dehydrogenase